MLGRAVTDASGNVVEVETTSPAVVEAAADGAETEEVAGVGVGAWAEEEVAGASEPTVLTGMECVD